MPSGTKWYFTFNGVQYNTTKNYYAISVVNGNYSLLIQNQSGYYVSSYPTTIEIDDKDYNLTVQFTAQPPKYIYSITIDELNLPLPFEWKVFTNNTYYYSNTSSLKIDKLANGTYVVDFYSFYDDGQNYNPSIASVSITISGSNSSYTITYSIVKYTFTVNEQGLASGVSWNIDFNNTVYSSTSSSISISVLNGKYSLSITPPSSYNVGTYPSIITISNASQSITVQFTKIATTYTIQFIESGLASGTVWEISFGGNYYSSSSSTITVSVPNGTYSLVVEGINGYSIGSYPSSITVNGVGQSIGIQFTATSTTPSPISNTSASGMLYFIEEYMPVIVIAFFIIGFMILAGIVRRD